MEALYFRVLLVMSLAHPFVLVFSHGLIVPDGIRPSDFETYLLLAASE